MTTCIEVGTFLMPKDPHFSSISTRAKTSRAKEILLNKTTGMDMMQDTPTTNRRSRPLRRLSSVFRRNERIDSSLTSMLDPGDSILDDEEHDRASVHSSGDSQQGERPVATTSHTENLNNEIRAVTNSRPRPRPRRRNSFASSRKLSSMVSSLKRISLDDSSASVAAASRKAPSSPVSSKKNKRFPLRRDSLEMVRRQASTGEVQYRPRELHPIMYPIEPENTNTSSYNNDHALSQDNVDNIQVAVAAPVTNAKRCDATTNNTTIPKDLLQSEAVGYARSA